MLTFHDTDKKFELQGDHLKTINNKNYYVHLAKARDRKFLLAFAKEIYFDEKAIGSKSIRDNSLKKLLKSHGIIVFGISTLPFTKKPY